MHMAAPAAGKQPVFEFTKRKKWADIVLSELPDTLLLILSTEHSVLYCGAAIKELLGWEIGELVDKDFGEYVNGAWFLCVL